MVFSNLNNFINGPSLIWLHHKAPFGDKRVSFSFWYLFVSPAMHGRHIWVMNPWASSSSLVSASSSVSASFWRYALGFQSIIFEGMQQFHSKLVHEYDQKIPQSQTADKPMAPRGRATQQSREIRKTN